MVKKLNQPTICSIKIVHDVVIERQNGKNAKFFSLIRDRWISRVKAYIKYKGSPEHIRPWVLIKHKKNSFLNLYLSPKPGSAQGEMLQQLRGHDLTLCPACGELGAPNTLDHYLPKSLYPDFAVTPLNLFPMCDACQRAKDNKTGDSSSPRYFIHPYFDTFANSQIVTLSISPPYDGPTFELGPTPGLKHEEDALVSTHIRELEIPTRYISFFTGQYKRLIRLVSDLRESDQDVIQLLKNFREFSRLHGENSWDHVFYSGVLSNSDLVDYLVNGELPPYT
jgi:hypothetical protein